MPTDLVGVIESIYRLQGTRESWLEGTLRGLLPHLDQGLGMAGYFFDTLAAPRIISERLISVGMNEQWIPIFQDVLAANHGPNQHTRRLLALSDGCGTASEVLGDLDAIPFYDRLHSKFPDAFMLVAADPGGTGCIIFAPLHERTLTLPAARRCWGQVGAHIATALRLRRALPALIDRPGAATDAGIEAIFSPAGKLHHLEGATWSTASVERLREGVRRRESARGRLRRLDPEEAVAEWGALIAGRWSLLDHVESDGVRVVIARRNDASVPSNRSLTTEQAQVLGCAMLGHSNKLIAYELGISENAVAMRLERARRKLGARSRTSLIERARHVLENGHAPLR